MLMYLLCLFAKESPCRRSQKGVVDNFILFLIYSFYSIACLAALKRHGECLALVNKRLEIERDNADLFVMRARLHFIFRNVSFEFEFIFHFSFLLFFASLSYPITLLRAFASISPAVLERKSPPISFWIITETWFWVLFEESNQIFLPCYFESLSNQLF